MKVKFSENNSGGSWWLGRKDYEALFAAGWRYQELESTSYCDYSKPFLDRSSDPVPYGWRHSTVGEFASLREAVESFERATGKDFFEEGCNCCGAPFSISTDGENEYEYISGDSVEREAKRPW